MPPQSPSRRPVTPSVLGLSLLCLLMPFFTVSCSGMMGSLTVSYSGFALAFDGLPSVQGTVSEELGRADLEELRVGVQPILLLTVLLVIAGVFATALVPRPKPRAVTGIVMSAVALLGLIANQIALHVGSEQEMRDTGAADHGVEFAELSVASGPGFWVMALMLAGALGWSVADLVLDRRTQGPLGHFRPTGPGGPGGPLPGFGGPGPDGGFSGPGQWSGPGYGPPPGTGGFPRADGGTGPQGPQVPHAGQQSPYPGPHVPHAGPYGTNPAAGGPTPPPGPGPYGTPPGHT
ncbi:hypothetical protein IDM40_22140 [Nocardiopsis sp. HNM0947]|uniref:Uncharacterized protein n=1 Tax=Nocardiopsis coralli TaxID=2772213 RepID=A0ABR9PC03_9ACTN|nr:hypothetical protein [Nocardiopsis coralli]MBE3001369.1 hypothetical protein [Nocardiopsis coralli]